MAAASVRHVAVHIGALGLADQQVHGHGGRARARAGAPGRGVRCAQLSRPSRARGRGHAGVAPVVCSQPQQSVPSSHGVAPGGMAPTASNGAAPTGHERTRGWLRSAAFHLWRRTALRRAFRCFLSSNQCSNTAMLPSSQMDVSECAGRGGVKRPHSALASTDLSAPLSALMNPHAPAFVPTSER